jgi:hypothetical protein
LGFAVVVVVVVVVVGISERANETSRGRGGDRRLSRVGFGFVVYVVVVYVVVGVFVLV